MAASGTSAARRGASSSGPSGSASCWSASAPRPHDEDATEQLARRAGPAGRHRRGRRGGPGRAAAPRHRARPPSSARARPSELRDLSIELDADTVVFDDELTPGPAVQPREAPRPHRHRPHRGDPRHLRPERPQPGGQGPGRAGPAALPPAPPAPGRWQLQPAGRRHRHPGSRRDPARGRSPPARAPHPQARGRAARHRPAIATPSARPSGGRGSTPVAIVGYTNAGKSTPAQPAHRGRRARRGPAVRHARRHHPPARAARRRGGAASPTRSGSSASCPTSWSRRSARRSTWWPRPTCWCTWSMPRRPNPSATSTRCARC